MKVQFVSLPALQYEKVHFLTVRFAGKDRSEFADFQLRMGRNKANQRELAELNRYIQLIGKKYGAGPQHFKTEDAAERLPPPYHRFIESDGPNNYGLRLYCIRLTPSIVILLNGDRKTAQKVQDCKNCFPHFNNARRIARKVNKALQESFMEIDHGGKEIVVDDDFELEI